MALMEPGGSAGSRMVRDRAAYRGFSTIVSCFQLPRGRRWVKGGVRFFVCEALRDLSTAAGVACDERPTRWASRFDIVTQPAC
jgi:hypothetical protein